MNELILVIDDDKEIARLLRGYLEQAQFRVLVAHNGEDALHALRSEHPDLLLLDEPTNHLDLQSIAAIEDGIRGFDGALIVASHDEDFLDAIGITRRVDLSKSARA